MERVAGPCFCEFRGCTQLAAWRIGFRDQGAELCSKHTVTTMRNRRIWVSQS